MDSMSTPAPAPRVLELLAQLEALRWTLRQLAETVVELTDEKLLEAWAELVELVAPEAAAGFDNERTPAPSWVELRLRVDELRADEQGELATELVRQVVRTTHLARQNRLRGALTESQAEISEADALARRKAAAVAELLFEERSR